MKKFLDNDGLTYFWSKIKSAIPDAQIQSDWNQTDSTAKDFIKNKPIGLASSLNVYKSIVAAICASSIDGFTVTETTNAEWDYVLTDSEDKVIAGIRTDGSLFVADIDSRGTMGSYTIAQINAAVAKAMTSEQETGIVAPVNSNDPTDPITTLACELGKYYRIDVPVETLAVTLPAMTDLTTVRMVVIYLTAGTTPAVTISSTAVSGGTAPDVVYQDGFEIEAGNTYEINCLWNGAAWIVAAVKIVVPEVEEEGGGE